MIDRWTLSELQRFDPKFAPAGINPRGVVKRTRRKATPIDPFPEIDPYIDQIRQSLFGWKTGIDKRPSCVALPLGIKSLIFVPSPSAEPMEPHVSEAFLLNARDAHEAGHPLAALDVVYLCAEKNVPAPEWAVEALPTGPKRHLKKQTWALRQVRQNIRHYERYTAVLYARTREAVWKKQSAQRAGQQLYLKNADAKADMIERSYEKVHQAYVRGKDAVYYHRLQSMQVLCALGQIRTRR